ncbi:ABC transporter ATP-binding protein [Atopobacter phocae]|uniref:ABC transporter ATP-binding protein n=1 Tax=Atopobacter phocae TaxID=136492 RepID=UPI0004702FCE|nr:ABC transporter ATP-binding protein [Atopobacter phocae]
MIEVEHVKKVINNKNILQDITFKINPGECVALIGQNGAGKTTLLSCMLGDKKINGGKILIHQQSPKTVSNKKQVAVLMQDNVIPTDFKVNELIQFFQSIHDRPLSLEEVRALLQFTSNQENQLADKLSGGQKRLLAFVLCLIGQPNMLFLDEPTAGMDTTTRQRFWEIVQQLKKQGVTIVYSSHYIEEVEHTADRILVLHQGQLIRDTTPYMMRKEETSKLVTVPIKFLSVVQTFDFIEDLKVSKEFIQFKTNQMEDIFSKLQVAGCTINDLEIQNKTLLNTLFDTTRED